MAVTAAQVRALQGAVTRTYRAGGTVNMGDPVYIDSSGYVQQADANVSAALVAARGVVVQVSREGETAAVSGDAVDVCLFGPVGGYSGLTPNAQQFVSSTAGGLTETAPTGAGTWTWAIGYAESATILFVEPGLQAPVSNS